VRTPTWIAGLAFVLASGCEAPPLARQVDDVAVFDVVEGDVADTGSDATGLGCVLFGADCADPGACCTATTPRCVPGVNGVNRCIPAGTGAEGDACGSRGLDDCAAGLVCVDGSDGARCRRLCEPGATCDAGMCETPPAVGGATWGVCPSG
jgi:hypothetical protein